MSCALNLLLWCLQYASALEYNLHQFRVMYTVNLYTGRSESGFVKI